MKLTMTLLASTLFFAHALAFAQEGDIRVQIEQLKKQVSQLESRSNSPTTPDNTIGGYGEAVYNHYTSDNSRTLADLQRFVLFFGHRFSDQLTFNSEVEWEHAVVSKDDKGEAEIEQAYLNYAFNAKVSLKAGLILMPFGFLNQSHEPPVFYGVERNEVETRIIPTTWREGGIGLYGLTDYGMDWDIGITTGFDVATFSDSSRPLASIHQELQLAKANDLSGYLALNYRKIPGLVFGISDFNGNSGQGNADFNQNNSLPDFGGINARINLLDLHARYQYRAWDFEGLFAQGSIDNADHLDSVIRSFNTANNKSLAYIPSQFNGWLLQAAYQIGLGHEMTLAPFVRYEYYNTQAGLPLGLSADAANSDRVATVGVSFKPLTQIVVKADYQRYFNNTANTRYDLGMGYMF